MQNTDAISQFITISLSGRSWIIERPGCLEELWNKLAEDDAARASFPSSPLKSRTSRRMAIDFEALARGFEQDERIPYWTEIWPAGIALAEWLQEQAQYIKGKYCLDLGCGLGFSAMFGAISGAKVLAMDYEPLALYYAARNYNANLLSPGGYTRGGNEASAGWLRFITADWRAPCFKPGVFNIIWAADIMYEHRFMRPVARFINHCLAPGGRIWIAEPGRGIYPEFARIMREHGWLVSVAGRKKAGLPGGVAVSADIQIWELEKNRMVR